MSFLLIVLETVMTGGSQSTFAVNTRVAWGLVLSV